MVDTVPRDVRVSNPQANTGDWDMSLITTADAVFQGGGVKGLAEVGAILEFADHGDVAIEQWVNLAGTSAGAIIAAYLATGHTTEQLSDLIQGMPVKSFEDWGSGGAVIGGALNLARCHGLAHGEAFRSWFDGELGGATCGSVRRQDVGPDKANDAYRLRLIATDTTQHKMLVLPNDLAFYRVLGSTRPIDPDEFLISNAVRMSMSIPFFFQPVILESIETGEPCTIVDGGVLSNFPVWLFDVPDRDPVRPTFGFHLTGGKDLGGPLEQIAEDFWPVGLGANIFHTASDAWDQRFVSESTIVRTCTIDVDPDIGTTDFALSDTAKQTLLKNGRDAAESFLDHFNPHAYRNTYGRQLAL
jgi:NTE family protein